ncbi:MAG TPA: hypothetical protein PK359_17060 [Burkholderiaceae bacterium]|nr:hypothetical protein [Burkholderiaceae bacterium]
MHYHSPVDFSLEADAGSFRSALTSPSTIVVEAVRSMGHASFDALSRHVAALPYGRVSRADHPLAVLQEGRGTCSSKHLLLACVAQGCGHFEVMLTVGIYPMCEDNTPGVGAVLEARGLSAMPGAHCYLTIDHQRLDFTGRPRGRSSVFSALTSEYFLAPEGLAGRKLQLHKQAIALWASEHGLSEQAAWELREACVASLTQASAAR